MREVVIVGAARTPIGSFQGELAPLKAPELGKIAIVEALRRSGASPSDVNEVFMGCVLPAGMGQAPARQASIFARAPEESPCTTISKVCGSGIKAVIWARRRSALGDADIVVAGGMESMSNVPYYLRRRAPGYRMGNADAIDGMIHDGLWDPYTNVHMGTCGDKCAREYKVSREAQDEYAKESSAARSRRRRKASSSGDRAVAVPQRKGDP